MRQCSKFRLVVTLLAFALATYVPMAWAQDKDPLDYPLRQYAFLLSVALLGGIVSWYTKVKNGTAQAWNVMHLIGELATSAFAGLIAFWICAYMGTPQLVTAALVGVSGHMGTRGIAMFEQWAAQRFGTVANHGSPYPPPQPQPPPQDGGPK